MNVPSIFTRIRAEVYWKERTIAFFMVTVYLVGNAVEFMTGKVADDPAIIWVVGVILGLAVVGLSLSDKYKSHTPLAFKIFLFYLNFNVMYAYAKSTQGPTDAEAFYLLFSYFLFVVCSQALDSRRELIIFTAAEIVLVAGALYSSLEYDPILLQSMQLFTFSFVLVGNFMINVQRLKLTQVSLDSNIQFKAISENSRDAQVMLDNNFRFVYLNPAVKALTGYEVSSLMKKEIYELVANQDIEKLKGVLEDVKKEEEKRLSLEYRIRTIEGNYVWVESIFSSFDRSPNDKSGLIFAETRNIESRKRLEQEIQDQLKVEEMLIKHSTQFINVERGEIQSGIDVALGEFGMMLKADAALVYRMHGKLHDEFQSTNQWFSPSELGQIQYFNLIVKN
jgi:PAS domain S-box-containing protein